MSSGPARCPSCGASVSPAGSFCGACGAVRPQAAAPRSGRGGGLAIFVALIISFAVIAAAAGAGLLLRPKDDSPTQPNPTVAAAASVKPTPAAAAGPTQRAGAPNAADTPGPIATGPVSEGFQDVDALVPPDPGEGDVPPVEQTTPTTGTLTLGATSDLASQTIGPAGGTMEASGFRLEFPEGALSVETTVSVTQAPVKASDFGGLFTPLTPLYTVTAGDGSLAVPVTVTLPATVPDGAVPLAFWYDAAAGTLTPLAPVGFDSTSITAAANHFSGIVGGEFNDAKAPAAVDSGFRPGIDDWQFSNHAAYVAPGGICEGMADTAIWYYTVQRKRGRASELTGLHDNNGAPVRTPAVWEDDSDAYRFASTLQVDPRADLGRWAATINRQLARSDGRMTYTAFRAAIAFTGEPQEIYLRRGSGTAANPYGAHSMILYRVGAGWLFVADPNYPGKRRTIRYDAAAGTLAKYASGDNAADIAAHGVRIYDKVAYVPWRSSTSEAQLAAHWSEFEQNKAGDAVFPKYELEALAGVDEAGAEVWVPLVDGHASLDRQLKIRVRDPANANHVAIKVFPGTSSTPLGRFAAQQTVDLKDGDTPIGIQVDFAKPGWNSWEYVDFVRVTIKLASVAVKIDPPKVACPQVGFDVTFGAKATGIPATVNRVQFTWDFGAGPEPGPTFVAPFASPLATEAQHSFPAEDGYNVTVTLTDITGASPFELAKDGYGINVYREGSMDWVLCNHDPTQP